MATDEKLEDLTELLSPADDDELAIDDIDAGPRETKRIKLQNLLGSLEYGGLAVKGGSGSQTLSTGTPSKITQFTNARFSTDDITPDPANDKIIIGRTGLYYVGFHCSFSGTGNVTWDVYIYLNGLQQFGAFERKLGVGGDVGNASAFDVVDVTSAPWDIDLRAEPDGVNEDFDVVHAGIFVFRLGAT
jgi:hypothetical protein